MFPEQYSDGEKTLRLEKYPKTCTPAENGGGGMKLIYRNIT